MTLVLTRLTPLGIAMAADSAVTWKESDGTRRAKPSEATKLFKVSGIPAGVSCWGRARNNGKDTEDWLKAFLESRGPFQSVAILAHRLGTAAQQDLANQVPKDEYMGFHIAGYESENGKLEPTFYHVHDGQSQFFPNADPAKINVHHDCPSVCLQRTFGQGLIQEMRNGEFRPYAVVREALGKAFQELNRVGMPSIAIKTLDDVSRYNVLEIRLMSNVYEMFGAPVIGGRVDSLTISPSGEIVTQSHDNSSGLKAETRFVPVEPKAPAIEHTGYSGTSSNVGDIARIGTSHVAVSGWQAQQ